MRVVCVLHVCFLVKLKCEIGSQICLSNPFSAMALRVRFTEDKNVKACVHMCTFV